METGNIRLDLSEPLVMGILNVTPDSFYGESRTFGEEEVLARVRRIRDEGASIIDIGGYSSRPGAADVSPAEELRRVSLGVAAARSEAPEVAISIDTFRAGVAREIITRYGPCIVNDISAGELDPDIVAVAAAEGVPYIAMHMRGTPSDMQQHTQYGDIASEVKEYLLGRADVLAKKGIKQIILDPGFGFAKTQGQNYELLSRLRDITSTEYPVLAGVSRKSMIYNLLEITPGESLPGTTALNWECLIQGAKILRVHDVAAAVQTVKLFRYYHEHGGGR